MPLNRSSQKQNKISPPQSRTPLEKAQLRLLALWKEKQLVGRRLLTYDTTNFYIYIASGNTRNQLAQRGHNKQGRHNLRQVGLSYVLDGENGLRLCHHVYPGNVADVEEFSTALGRITRMLDQNQMARETVTLVLDKGGAALANAVALQERDWAGFPPCPGTRRRQNCGAVRSRSCRCAAALNPPVRATGEKVLVHGHVW